MVKQALLLHIINISEKSALGFCDTAF